MCLTATVPVEVEWRGGGRVAKQQPCGIPYQQKPGKERSQPGPEQKRIVQSWWKSTLLNHKTEQNSIFKGPGTISNGSTIKAQKVYVCLANVCLPIYSFHSLGHGVSREKIWRDERELGGYCILARCVSAATYISRGTRIMKGGGICQQYSLTLSSYLEGQPRQTCEISSCHTALTFVRIV